MNRFKAMAAIFGVLTLGLACEAALSATHAVEALLGIGAPRVVIPGLMNLGLVALSLTVAVLTFHLAWPQLTRARIQASTRDHTA